MPENTHPTKNIILLIDNLPNLADALDREWQEMIFGDTQLGIDKFRSLISELEKTTARIKEIFEETAATKP
jgi:GTP1/Obg family GTP-binding protein